MDLTSWGRFFIHHKHNEPGHVAIEIGVDARKPTLVNAFSRSLNDIDHLAINYSAATIVIQSTDRPDLIVREYMLLDEAQYYAKVDQTASTLIIRAGDRPAKDKLHIRIEIEVPITYHERLEINSVSGTIKLVNLPQLRHLAITSTSGSIALSQVKTRSLLIDSVSGAINGEQLTSNDTTINAVTGNVALTTTYGHYDVHCDAGALRLIDAHGSGRFNVTSGSAKLAFTTVDGNITAESSAGSVRLQVPRTLSYRFNLETSIGTLKTPEKAHFSNNERRYQTGAVGDASDLLISMLTVVGSLVLEAH